MSLTEISARIDAAGFALNHALEQMKLSGKELTAAKAEAAKLIAEDSPETFTKIGERYISERDLNATIDKAVRVATAELIAKLAALPPAKKGRA